MNYINARVLKEAQVIMETGYTIREIAKMFHVSKSTVHKDIASRLLHINSGLAIEVRKVLDENKAERHIRGGQATKLKYIKEHNEKCNKQEMKM